MNTGDAKLGYGLWLFENANEVEMMHGESMEEMPTRQETKMTYVTACDGSAAVAKQELYLGPLRRPDIFRRTLLL